MGRINLGISIVKMTLDEFMAWERKEGLIDLDEELYYSYEEAYNMYKEGLKEHYNELGVEDNHDYTFEDFTDENSIYTYYDLDYIFESWDYRTIYTEEDNTPFVYVVISTAN